jgi:hypothetical protein
LVTVDSRELPRNGRAYVDRLALVERLERASVEEEDLDTARLILRIQGGDRDALGALYMRYFDRLYAYLRILLSDDHEAEDAVQRVFQGSVALL